MVAQRDELFFVLDGVFVSETSDLEFTIDESQLAILLFHLLVVLDDLGELRRRDWRVSGKQGENVPEQHLQIVNTLLVR